jgi:DNA-binding FadR family transcriptional regulator
VARPQNASADLSAQIAAAIRDAIVSGELIVDARLPSEAELSTQFCVSRPTVREALKRLAAQSLIRTQRGATGGAFVNRLSYAEAYRQQITTSTLLLSMNDVDFDTACEARYTMERACAPLAAKRREDEHLNRMRSEIARQQEPDLADSDFCASDVGFHRALVDAATNPVLSYQLAGAVEAMQPLMKMITFNAPYRETLIALHIRIADAMEQKDASSVVAGLDDLQRETMALSRKAIAKRAART